MLAHTSRTKRAHSREHPFTCGDRAGMQDLAARDEEMKAQYGDILQRFYNLFDSIYRYVQDFLQVSAGSPFICPSPLALTPGMHHHAHDAAQFIEDIREGVFIQHTMESMLFDPSGKQLMAEAVYLYGVMLTLMDCKIDGAVRERILVAYYRVKVRTRGASFATKVLLQAGCGHLLTHWALG